MDLLDNKLCDDPYYRDNLLEFYKYESENWTYTRSFFVDEEFDTRKQVEMVFEGLDTHARIEINGIYLGDTNNAHRTWVFPVDKEFVHVGETNSIKITFSSAVLHDLAAEKAFNETYNMTLPFNYSFSRKAAYHYGWDWGPRLVTAGIWKDIKIRAYNYVQFPSVHFRNDKVTVDTAKKSIRIFGSADLRVVRGPENGYEYRLIVLDNKTQQIYYNQNFIANFTPINAHEESGRRLSDSSNLGISVTDNSVPFEFTIQKPSIWWTWNLGQ